MNAAIVLRTLSLIPDRVIRAQSGSFFDPTAQGGCAHPERVTHLAQFLDWLGPLREVTKDDLRILGLVTPYGKPAIDAPSDEEADAEGEIEPGMAADTTLSPLPAAAGEQSRHDACSPPVVSIQPSGGVNA